MKYLQKCKFFYRYIRYYKYLRDKRQSKQPAGDTPREYEREALVGLGTIPTNHKFNLHKQQPSAPPAEEMYPHLPPKY
jgi:hypothetical protein